MISKNKTIVLIEKYLQNIIDQENTEENINLIDKNIKELITDIPVREFAIRLIRIIKSLSEAKQSFSHYAFTELNSSLEQNYVENLQKSTENTIIELTNEIKKITNSNDIKEFENVIHKLISKITEYMQEMNRIIGILFSENKKKCSETLKWENLVVEINNELQNLKLKFEIESENKNKLEKSNEELNKSNKDLIDFVKQIQLKSNKENEELRNIVKQMELKVNKNKEEIKKLKQDNFIIVDEAGKSREECNLLKKGNKKMEIKIINLEQEIKELRTNCNNLMKKNIDNYYLKKDLEKLKQENSEIEKRYSTKIKSINKEAKYKSEDEITKYIVNESNLSFVNNRDNFNSIIYIFLIANGEDFENIEKNKFKYLKKLKLDNSFSEFFSVIENDLSDWNREAHSGFDKNILYNLFKLIGKEDIYNTKYKDYFPDILIEKVKKLLNERVKFKLGLLEKEQFKKDYENVKQMILSKKILDICK